jgi:hypothetical protein
VRLYEPKWVNRRWDEMSRSLGIEPLLERPGRHGIRTTNAHLKALAHAEKYFGINEEYYGPNAYKFLAMAMALVLFPGGKHEKGRPKGTKTWTNQKLLDLADAFSLLKVKHPALSDAEICRRLGRGGDPKSEFKYYDPDHLRTLLPKVKLAVRQWERDAMRFLNEDP